MRRHGPPRQHPGVGRRRAARQHRHAPGPWTQRTARLDQARLDQLDRRRRRVVRAQRPRHARGGRPRRIHAADDAFQLCQRNPAGPQEADPVAAAGRYRRLESHLAFAAVEHESDAITQFVPDMRGPGRADATEAVRGRRGDAPAETPEQCLGDGMRRYAQCHRVLAAGHLVQDPRGPRQHERQRPRPECLRQLAGRLGEIARPVQYLPGRGQVDDQRMVRRTPLRGEDPGNRCGIRGVGAEAVDGLGRKGDQFPRLQPARGIVDRPLVHAGHDCMAPLAHGLTRPATGSSRCRPRRGATGKGASSACPASAS